DVEVREAALDLRYVGQEYTLPLRPPGQGGFVAPAPNATAAVFTRDYERTFGHTLDEPVEIVTIRATARRPFRPRDEKPVSRDRSNEVQSRRTINAFSFTQGNRIDFAVVDRDTLSPGSRLSGPTIVPEETATTYVDKGFELFVHEGGALVIRGKEN